MAEKKEKAKQYTWTQTDNSLTIIIPMKRIPVSKVDVYMSDVYIKVNVSIIKLIVVLDLFKEIDFSSSKNKIQMREEGLELFVEKVSPEIWPMLCFSETKENLRKRREESVARERVVAEEKAKLAEKKKIEMDRHTLEEQMALEQAQRNLIRSRKEEEKLKAEADLYETLEKLDDKEEAEKDSYSVRRAGPLIEDVTDAPMLSKSKNIFEDSEIMQIGTKEEPKIRERSTVKLGFTEKKYPLLAMRETQLKEPPLPKNLLKGKKDEESISFEEKNPLWLKEKGDNFFNNSDFISALNAYNKAIEGNPEFLKCYLNRVTTYIKLRAYKNVIDDCNTILNLLEKQKKEEDEEFFEKMALRTYVKKGAALCWTGEFDAAIESYEKALAFKSRLSPKELAQIEADISQMKRRQASMNFKTEGDDLLLEANLLEALEKYSQGIEVDSSNEYLYSNMSLAHLKLGNYEKCIEICNKALEVIRSFNKDSTNFDIDRKLEIKLLLRRARSYEILKNYKSAKEDLDFCLVFEPNNSEAVSLLTGVQKNLNAMLIEEARSTGQKLQSEKKFAEALEKYDECLKVTKRESSLENISIYVNKIACLLFLGKHKTAIDTCDLALRLTNSFKNKHLSNKQSDLESQQEKIRQMEIRIYMRKSNAHAHLQSIGQAIEACKKALELDPDNEKIKSNLAALQDDSK